MVCLHLLLPILLAFKLSAFVIFYMGWSRSKGHQKGKGLWRPSLATPQAAQGEVGFHSLPKARQSQHQGHFW
jgi:hypothetical protein